MGRKIITAVVCFSLLGMILTLAACQAEKGKIAFVGPKDTSGNYPFYVMDEDGKNQVRLTEANRLTYSFATATEKTARLAYIERSENKSWISIIDIDGSNHRKLLDITKFQMADISITADGGTVLLTGDSEPLEEVFNDENISRDVYIVVVATGFSKQITYTKDLYENRAYFSPDGKKVAFWGWTFGDHVKSNIYVTDADGSNLKKLTEYSELFRGVLSWSPDSNTISTAPDSFLLPRDTKPNRDIYAIEVTSGNSVNLTNSPNTDDYDPAWSPDGKKIVFSSGNNIDGYYINIMNADGGNINQLSNLVDSYIPLGSYSWLPNGKEIIFTNPQNVFEILALDINTKNIRILATSNITVISPVWISR